MRKKIYFYFFFLYIAGAVLFNFFGFFMPNFSNFNYPVCGFSFFQIKKILKINPKIQEIYVNFDQKKIEIIFKKFIGFTKIDEKILFIEINGNLLEIDENPHNFIEITGEYYLWYKYYSQFCKIKPELFKKITKIHIYFHRIDVILERKIIIKLYKSIIDLDYFFNDFPYFFAENTIIDLRNPRSVCIILPNKIAN